MRESTCASGTEVTQAFISRVCMSNVLLFAHHVTSAETCAVSLSLGAEPLDFASKNTCPSSALTFISKTCMYFSKNAPNINPTCQVRVPRF